MTEDEARTICREYDATLSLRRRGGDRRYVHVCRFIPYTEAQQLGRAVSHSNGQQFDKYVCSEERLAQLTRVELEAKIHALPLNPHKEPEEVDRRRHAGTVKRFKQLRQGAIQTTRQYIQQMGGDPNEATEAEALAALEELTSRQPHSEVARWHKYATQRQFALFREEFEAQASTIREARALVARQQAETEVLATKVAELALLNALRGIREPVAAVWQRLGWKRKAMEALINAEYNTLVGQGMRLFVATVSHSRLEKYIMVNGTRYSDICREQTLERRNPDVDHWHAEAQTPDPNCNL